MPTYIFILYRNDFNSNKNSKFEFNKGFGSANNTDAKNNIDNFFSSKGFGNSENKANNFQSGFRNENNNDNNHFSKFNQNNFGGDGDNRRGGGRGGGGFRGRGRGFENGRFNNNNRNNYNNPRDENNFNNYREQKEYVLEYKFYMENQKFIDKTKEIFNYLNKNEIINFIKYFENNLKITIFEFLNLLYRENINKKHLNSTNDTTKRNFLKNMNIFEMEKNLVDSSHEHMINFYKTKPETNSNQENFLNENYKTEEEKRRIIKKDQDGFYNYLPVECKEHFLKINSPDDSCIYAHNENEINYHSLFYKTSFCASKNCVKEELCENAHGANDFRKIYESLERKEGFVKYTRKAEKFLKEKNILKNYLDYLEKPVSFSLDDFKVHPCNVKMCNTDSHLCYFYHNDYEKRRHPVLFNLENIKCEYKFLNSNQPSPIDCVNVKKIK